jgi:hypothetical protein
VKCPVGDRAYNCVGQSGLPGGGRAGANLVRQTKFYPERKALIFVNNRLEGNALRTVEAMLNAAEV